MYIHFLDKRKVINKNTLFKVEDVFGDIITQDSVSPGKMTQLEKFLVKIM